MSKEKKALKAADRCPNCGGTLEAHPAPDQRTIVRTMLESQPNTSAPYAENFAAQHVEKEAEHGVVHVCTGCRYVTRIPRAA